jgi:hypothetical protein
MSTGILQNQTTPLVRPVRAARRRPLRRSARAIVPELGGTLEVGEVFDDRRVFLDA